jgi:Leucine-rich repeat (LRR) protein
MPPHHTTWIVAFRREYDPVWRDFELTVGDFHPPMLSMRLFGEEPAKDVLAALAEAAHLMLDHALVTDLVQAAARDGRVAAVDLGIGLLVLSELAARKGTDHLSVDDYRFAGGSAGLLTGYISDRLDRFRGAEREAVLKALLALTDRDTQQRLAEGRSLDELAQEATWPPPRLQECLDYLAAPHVRLLEKPPVNPRHLPWYRLPHERVIPSLQQLTGVILAAVGQARLTFENAFRAWQNNGQRRRYLLDRRTLKQVKIHLAQLLLGDASEPKAQFLERSRRHRHRMLLAEVMLGVLVVGIIAAGLWLDTRRRHANDLSAWALPRDLYTYQHQLNTLEITAPVRHLRWLKAKLTTLRIEGSAVQDFMALPPTLRVLDVRSPGLTSLAGLEKLPQLTTLTLSGPGPINLTGLEKLPQLTTLTLNGRGPINLAGLEKLPQLTTLTLNFTDLTSLAGLEKLPQLTTLTLVINPKLTNLARLEKLPQLTTLTLNYNTGLTSLAGLEKLLQLTIPDWSGLDLTSLAGLEKLSQLTTLTLNFSDLAALTTRLTRLQRLNEPPQLTTLTLNYTDLTRRAGVKRPPQLTTLTLNYNTGLTSLAGLEKLPQLTTLTLSGPSLTNLAGLEKLPQLTTLTLDYTGLTSLAGLEKLPQLTTLTLVNNTNLTSLAGLEKLPQLTTLDLRGTGITSIKTLSSSHSLKTLYVPKEVHSLDGLPASVNHLVLQ